MYVVLIDSKANFIRGGGKDREGEDGKLPRGKEWAITCMDLVCMFKTIRFSILLWKWLSLWFP